MQVKIVGPTYENSTHGTVAYADASAVMAENGQSVTLFVVNRSPDQPLELAAHFAGLEEFKLQAHTVLHHDDPKAVNDEANPHRVEPMEAAVKSQSEFIVLGPLSWNVLRFGLLT